MREGEDARTVHIVRDTSIGHSNIFLISIRGGGVQLGPLGTAATNRPIVPPQDRYDDGEIGGIMIGKGNRSTRRKLSQCRFVNHKPHMLPGREPGPPRWEASH
jgi:hypothetical protein